MQLFIVDGLLLDSRFRPILSIPAGLLLALFGVGMLLLLAGAVRDRLFGGDGS